MLESGIIDYWKTSQSGKFRILKYRSTTSSDIRESLSQIVYIYYFYFAGVFTAIVCFVCEIIYHKYFYKKNYKNTLFEYVE